MTHIDARTITDSAVCDISHRLMGIEAQMEALEEEKARLQLAVRDGLDMTMSDNTVQCTDATLRHHIIIEAMYRAAQRKDGETLNIDLGFEPSELERVNMLTAWHETEDVDGTNSYTLNGSAISFNAYQSV